MPKCSCSVLKQRRNQMRQGQLLWIFTYLMSIAFGRKAAVALPAVCDHSTARRHSGLNEGFQRDRTYVRQNSQTNPPDSFELLVFHGDSNGDLPRCSATAISWFSFSPNVGFIDLDSPHQLVATRSDHRTAKLVKPLPSGLVAAKSQRPLQTKGVGTILLACYMPDRPEPEVKGLRTPCRMVPAVTEVCRLHARQCQSSREVVHAVWPPH